MILGLAPAIPVAYAQELLPELAAPAAKHKAADEALDKQKQEAVALAAKSYVSALDAIEKTATTAGQLDLVAAVVKEREAVTSGSLEPDIPAALPKAKLQMSRKALLAKLDLLNADFAKRRKQADADYLRFLATLQTKAATNPELAKQLAAEKAALLAGDGANSESGSQSAKKTRGKNVVVNGDFEKIVDGKPDGWKHAENVKVENDNSNTFVRFVNLANNDGTVRGTILRQSIELPKGAKSATISFKLRTTDCVMPSAKEQKKPAAAIAFMNQKGESFSWIGQSWSGKNGSWKTVQAEGPIPKDASTVDVTLERGHCPGQIDFDDVEVTFK